MGFQVSESQLREWESRGLIPRESPAVTPARSPAPVPTSAPRRIVIEVDVPVKTVSEANTGGQLRGKLQRKRELKAATTEALPGLAQRLPLPVLVTLTRFGRGKLDDDNLRPALKVIRDAVAAWIGLDDADPRIKWRYRQRAAWSPFVRIRIEHRGT